MSSLTQEFALGFFAVAVVVALPLMGETAQAFDRTWTECVADLNGDNVVDLSDLATLLAHHRMTAGAHYEDGDLDGDGDVDLADLAALLAVYGTTCP